MCEFSCTCILTNSRNTRNAMVKLHVIFVSILLMNNLQTGIQNLGVIFRVVHNTKYILIIIMFGELDTI